MLSLEQRVAELELAYGRIEQLCLKTFETTDKSMSKVFDLVGNYAEKFDAIQKLVGAIELEIATEIASRGRIYTGGLGK